MGAHDSPDKRNGEQMKAMKLIAGLLGILVVAPIWYYLIYQVLRRVDASELMWFLFWIYLPVGIFVQTLQKITESASD